MRHRVQSEAFDDESVAEALLEGILEGTTIKLDKLEMDGTRIRPQIFDVVEVDD